jgi:hypothetical protein
MRNYFIYALLLLSANTWATDSFNSSTNTLQLDSVVANGAQYNNVAVQLSGYNVISQGSTGIPYPTPNTSTFPATSNCQSGPVPTSWIAPNCAGTSKPCTTNPLPNPNPADTPISSLPAQATSLNSMTLVMFRHGEKAVYTTGTQAGQTVAENGNMSTIGLTRAANLPSTLNNYFGCPNYTIAPNPSLMVGNGSQWYNYVRPLATIQPTAAVLGFPLYTPYGYQNTPWLASDLLTNPVFQQQAGQQPNIAFIAWEHNNIGVMTDYIVSAGASNLTANGLTIDPPTQTSPFPLNGQYYKCQSMPSPIVGSWPSCDYDSIWVLQIHDGTHACFIHAYENLNNSQYQSNCSPSFTSGNNPQPVSP